MQKPFVLEKREAFNKPYLKVLYVNESLLKDVQKVISILPSVKKVNITNNTMTDLTVYPKPNYGIQEMEKETLNALDLYFKDGIITKDAFSTLFDVVEQLQPYQKAHNLYKEASSKLVKGEHFRNAIDDIRLALELLLKEILHNQAPLEKQQTNLSNYFKGRGVNDDVRNIVVQTLPKLINYFNNNVKHNNRVKTKDVEFIVNQTNVIVEQIVKCERSIEDEIQKEY